MTLSVGADLTVAANISSRRGAGSSATGTDGNITFNGSLAANTFNINNAIALAAASVTINGNGSIDRLARGGTTSTTNTWTITNVNDGTLAFGTNTINFVGIADLTGGDGQDNFIIDNANGTLSGLMDGGGGGTDTLTISNNTTNSNNRIIQLGSGVNAAANLTVDRVETITANSGTTANNTLIAPDTTSNVWAIGATEATNTVLDGVTTTTFSNFANVRGGNHTATGTEQFTVNSVSAQTLANSVTNINTGNVANAGVTINAGGLVSGTITAGSVSNTVNIYGTAGAIDGVANNGNNTITVYAGGIVNNAITTGSGNDIIVVGEAAAATPAATVGSIDVGNGTTNSVTVYSGAGVTGAITGGSGADTISVIGTAGSISTLGDNDAITIASPAAITSLLANAIDGGTGTGDSLTVNSAGNTWVLSSSTSGTVSNAGTTRGFVNVEGFVDNGSGGNATLDYSSILGSVSVNLGLIGGFSNIIGNNDGGTAVPAGNDSTLLGTNFNTTWTINGTNSGEVIWTGQPTAITFSRFNNLTGGTGTDDFNFRVHPTTSATGSITGLVRGGGLGVNTISGLNAANFWSITAANTGNLNAGTTDTTTNYVSFQEIRNLNGGDADDIFSFSAAVTGSVTINGDGAGVQTGVDRVSLASLTGQAVSVQLGATGFNGIEQFTGNNTDSTLTGANIANTWTIAGANAGCVNGTGPTCVGGTSFTGFTALVGAQNQNDTFNFNVTPTVAAVTVDGRGQSGAAGDIVSFASLTAQAVNVQLGATGFNGIEQFTGNNTNSTLTGANITNTWTIAGANAGCVGGTGPTCVGGTSFTGFTALVGALNQNDTFNFNVTPTVAAVTVDGRGQVANTTGDTVSFASLTGQAVSVQLGAAGFNGIEGFTGNNTDSTLLAGNGTNNWFLTGTNDGSVNTIAFTNFNKLVGGTGDDTFNLNTNGQLTGFIDGGGAPGTNTLNINASADTIIRLVDTQPTGSIANPAGTFTVYQVGFLNGNSANNHTLALDVSNTQTTSVAWGIGTENAGTVNFGTIATFTGFRNLTGSAVNDTFTLTSGSVQELVTGLINGGGQTVGGEDVLILTGMTGGAAGVDVRLGNTTTAGELNVDGIERITGNGNAASILTADNGTNDWTITGANDGSVRLNFGTANQYDVAFTDFNALSGGSGNDNFRILFNGTLLASVAGGDHVVNTQGDTIDYSAQNTVAVNFGTGAFNGITQIESVRGNGTNSTISGPTSGSPNWVVTGINTGSVTDDSNITLGFQGFNYLVGGAGNDTFVITNGSLRNVVTNVPGLIRGGGGTNIVNVSLTGVGTSSGQINYLGSGTSADTVNFNPTTSVGYEASYTPVVTITDSNNATNSGTYEQLNYSYANGAGVNTSLALNYQNVDAVSSQLAVNTLTVNGSSTSGTTRLGVGTFTVGTRTQVAYSGVSNITAAGQSAVEVNGTNITGTLTLANTGPITGSGLTAGTLVLDTTGSFGAAGTPINTSIDNLRLINAGPVYIAELNGLSLFTTGTVVNAGSFVIAGTTNIDAGGGSLTLDNAANDFDTLNVSNAASVNLRDRDRIEGGTMNAASVTLNTVNGVGIVNVPLTTITSNLTINNTVDGGVYVNNTGSVTARITNFGDIGLNNSGNLTIDRLYSGGSNFLDRNLYRDVTLNVTNGSVQGVSTNSIYTAPDITAFDLTVIVQGGGGFGNPGRPMSISVVDTFSYIGGRGYVHYFGGRPREVFGVADLVVFSGLDTLSSLRLLEIESLDEFDPAIFTEVRNYYYEDVAIMMPADQRLDGTDEEEKDEQKEGKL